MRETTQLILTVLPAILIFFGALAQAQDEDSKEIIIDGTLHTPAEVFLLLEKSNLKYVLSFAEDTMKLVDSFPHQYFNVDFYLSVKDDGSSELKVYEVNKAIVSALDSAEACFQQKEYQEAIFGYRKVLNLYPQYYGMYTWIAQTYNLLGQTDSSLYYYKLSIDSNFVDFHAHWFLGNLFWNMDDTALALKHLTIAHIFNRFHVRLKNRLIKIRELAGNPWQEWEFRPLYQMSRQGNVVNINSTINWMMYAFTMSLWEYETGYAENMMGQSIDSLLFNPKAEREATAVWTAGKINVSESDSTELSPDVARIKSIIEDGSLMPMIYYELAASRWPKAMLLMPRETIDNMVTYVNTYH